MTQFKLKFEHLFYIAAFLLALAVRLAAAGRMPLSDLEAGLALQAMDLSHGQAPTLSPHPLYLTLTTFLMFLFSPNNWMARFWPALVGSLMVFLPLFFRDGQAGHVLPQRFRLGSLSAVLFSFFLALDPGLAAISRQAGSLSLALFFTLLAVLLWQHHRIELAGIAAGLALLGGPGVWPGLIGLVAAAYLAGLPAQLAAARSPVGMETDVQPANRWQRGIIFALATVFFAGTLFFSIPNGISALAGSIPEYLRGWLPRNSGAETASIQQILAALLAYEFLPLVFGLWGGIRGLLRKNQLDRFLLIWWAVAFGLALAYPGHRVVDLAWSLAPLCFLAARQISRLASHAVSDRMPMLAQAALTALIFGFISMTLVSMVNTAPANSMEHWVRLGGAGLMLVASTGLIAWGWARDVALRGLAWGLAAVLFIYFISAVWNSSGMASRAGHELWSGPSMVQQADLIQGTLYDLDFQGPVLTGGPDLAVTQVTSPSLRWLLRNVQKASYTAQLSSDASPALVITADQPELALAAMYRGQSFVLTQSVNWDRLTPAEWFRWIAFRSLPGDIVLQNRVILWARSDFFPGGIEVISLEEVPQEDIHQQ